MLVLGLSRLSETDTPGRSIQQASTQAVFQCRDMFTGARPGKLKMLCCGRKITLVNDRHEDGHAGKSIHGAPSFSTTVSI